MNRKLRLTQSSDFQRVRRFGKSYAHPLIVLVVLPAPGEHTRVGVAAGKSVGNAVQRNRAKRMLREAARSLYTRILPGWKVILISRKPILTAELDEIQDCLVKLFSRGGLIEEQNAS